jgi:hypothetical protein
MRELAAAGAELSSLSAFALAQPLFDLLSRNAEVFAVRGSMSGDIVLFAVSLVVVPPLALLALEALAGLADRRLRLGLHVVFVAGLIGLFAAQALKKVDGFGSLAILACTALLVTVAAAAIRASRPCGDY